MRPTARTRVFALLGNPVRHSLSPRIHNAAFLAAGIDAVYVALAAAEAGLRAMVHTLVQNGGGGNITIPHKRVMAAVTGAGSVRVRTLGIANVFGADATGAVACDNTDVDGILAAHAAIGKPDGAWLVLGTGGSARAVAGAALECGVSLGVRSRSAEHAAEFASWATSLGITIVAPEECTVAINATPLGLNPADPFPLDPVALAGVRAVIDLTYQPDGESRWVVACRAAGCQAIDGREVLLVQGAASWKLWFPGIAPPVEVMRAALDGHLG